MTSAAAGNLGAFVSALLFGASVVATRVAVRDVPPISLAVLRFGQGGLLLFLVLFAAARGLLRVERRDVPSLALLGVILFAVFPVTFNAALDLTTASRGSLVLATMPIWSALLAGVAGREALIRRQVGGLVLSIAGVTVVFAEEGIDLGSGAGATTGNALMLLTALCGGVYHVLAKPVIGRYGPLTVTASAMAFGTFLLLPVGFLGGLPEAVAALNGRAIGLVLFLGVFGGALAFFLNSFALARLTPTQTAVYINLNPMVATILAAALLDEPISGAFAVGFVAVVGGLLLVNWPRPTVASGERPMAAGLGR